MAKITIDFGCDFVREYSLTRDLDQKLRQGEILKIEAMHPRHAEYMVATSASNPSSAKTITIPLELAEELLQEYKRACYCAEDRMIDDSFHALEGVIEAHKIQAYANRAIADNLIVPPINPKLFDVHPADVLMSTFAPNNLRYTHAFLDEYNKGIANGDDNA